MTVMETETRTAFMFTVQPFATVPVDGDAGPLMDQVLSALEANSLPIAPTVDYDYDKKRLTAIFQIGYRFAGGSLTLAASDAAAAFRNALQRGGVFGASIGLSIVEGDDPDLLP